ncbi:MAG: [protein-PII] uridylyltransferase [Polynucleobacter sp.]|nr:[protein-PII] uridylyltransferase [Polynucleobacter sp.]
MLEAEIINPSKILKAARQICFEKFERTQNVSQLMQGLTLATDAALIQLWDEANLSLDGALLAVGGYGRNELFPYSDIDILVLLNDSAGINQNQITPEINQKVEQFITRCWDSGLEIASAVRTISECLSEAELDITIRTSLLEARFIQGNRGLYKQFNQSYMAAMDPQSFFQAKLLEQQQRHHKYHDTPYSLEPNCKESPGGLRDLQIILWGSKAAKFGNRFQDLHKKGLITARELKELNRNQKYLQVLRAHLHLLAGRRQDILAFDLQAALAERMNMKAESTRLASEKVMRGYYWAAKAVSQLNNILTQNLEALLFPSESKTTYPVASDPHGHFIERQGVLDIQDPQLFQKNPEEILRCFLYFTKTPGINGLSPAIFRGLYNARQLMDSAWRKQEVNRACFIEILKQPDGVSRAFQLMNQTSVLGRYLPAFRRIVGQMQHDLFHVYTVDQHILMVLRNVRRFMIIENTHEFPYCSRLIATFEKSWLIVLAALFHDIAKGRGGDHSDLGKRDARQFGKEHHLETADIELIVWLVSEHLTMSQIAQKQDIADPDVIKAFAKKVRDERHLTALYLLTVADIRGTSPKVWNAWKGKLLEDLYRSTLRFLGGAKPDPSSDLARHQEEARQQLRLFGIEDSASDHLWQKLDVAFFLRQEASDIAWLTRHLFNRVDSQEPVVRARLSPAGEGLQVAVYVKDQEDLFARICAYFERHHFSIWDARIHTTRHGYALDTFQIEGSDLIDESGNYRDLIQLVEYELTESLQQRTPLPDPNMGRISRQSRTFPIQPRVSMQPDEKGQYFSLAISASDRTGLLYAVARALAKHQVSLHTAKINTLGERVEDILLIDAAQLSKNPKLQIQLETDLLDVLAS